MRRRPFYRRATEAYETLVDPDRRQEYDAHGFASPVDEPATVEFQGFDFSASGTGGGVSATFRELFSEVLEHTGPGGTPAEAERGSDVHGEIALGFHESLAGTERRLAITRLDVCEGCGGTGRRRAMAGRCTTCHGAGTTRWRRGHMIFSKSCADCGGSGRMRYHQCGACGGEGTVARESAITIQVPAGIGDGACLRIEAQGNAGRRGGARGDLYITARVEGHRFLRREGDDLYVDLARRRARGSARRPRRGTDGRGTGLAPDPARHAGGRPVPAAGARRAVAPHRAARRPRRDGDDRSAAGPRRAVAAGCSGSSAACRGPTCGRTCSRASRMTPRAAAKAHYMISAVAQRYDIHPQTLRLYEREGLLKPSRTEGNTRMYSEEDLERLETILSLTRDLGVNLAGVEIILNMREKMDRMQREVNEFMAYVRQELERGLGDWEQRLGTALVRSGPSDLVRPSDGTLRTPQDPPSPSDPGPRDTS